MEANEKLESVDVKKLHDDFIETAEKYLSTLINRWDVYGYWGDEVGGLFCFSDSESITYDDIRYCVENKVELEQYLEWSDYCTKAYEYGFHKINLKSWLLGCPRIPQDTFAHLDSLKRDFEKAIEDVKNNEDAGLY